MNDVEQIFQIQRLGQLLEKEREYAMLDNEIQRIGEFRGTLSMC